MKRILNKLGKSKNPKDPSPTITNTLGSSSESATSTSTIITSIADPMPSVLASASATASVQVIQAPVITSAHEQLPVSSSVSDSALAPVSAQSNTVHELKVSALAVNDLASVTHLEGNLPFFSDAAMQVELGSTESERNFSQSGSGLFSNSQNLSFIGGTFNNIINMNSGEAQMKIPVPQKPNSSPLFTGRKDVLDKLRGIFVHHVNSTLMSRHSCLLWGMGGIGKTQICLKFTEEVSDSFSHVFWVDASSHESITISLRGISSIPVAQASGVGGSVESVLQWISHIQEKWLIVFDNADDPPPEVVAKFIPPGNKGNILITSRNRSMGRVISFENSIEIEEMEEPDAIALLLKASCLNPSDKHLEAAKRIVAELGCIPLAVDHAGAYIEAGKCNINRYLRQFSLHRQTLMSDATYTGASSYDQTVYGTWDLSFKEIEKRADRQSTVGDAQAAHAAILILQICAFYHHNNISKDIFQSAAEESNKHIDSEVAFQLPMEPTSLNQTLLALDIDGHWDDFIFGQGIGVLLSFSLIKRGQSPEIFSVHPLMHCWSRERMSKYEQQRMYEMGRIILSCAIPWRFTSQDYALRKLIFPHIQANELHGSQLGLLKQHGHDKCNNFALVMSENGDWNSAEKLFFQVMDMRKRFLGTEHPKTLTSMENLAHTYCNQGRWGEAEQLQVQAVNMSKKLLGTEHSGTLMSMGNLASLYFNQGKLNEAEDLGVKVIEIQKELLGEEHPSTLRCIANLATVYHYQGKWNRAEQLQGQVMDMRKNLLGAEHPETLISTANLAGTYLSQGRWNEAEQLQVQVMEVMKKMFGAEHPDTLRSIANLAGTYCKQEIFNKAEQMQVQVIEMMKKVFGAEHPETLRNIGNLAGTYFKQEKFNKAEQMQVQVLDMSKKVFGAEHPETLRNIGNLAGTYCKQERFDKAEQMQVQVVEMMKKVFGAEHPETLRNIGNLAGTYFKQEKFNKAEPMQVQVLDMRKKLFGVEHPSTLIIMENLASTYYKQEKWNEAGQLGVQVLDIKKKQLGAEHPDTLIRMECLAIIYCCQGRWNEAEQLEAQVLDIRKKQLGAEHPDTITSMMNLWIIESLR